ncbi:Spx/MgsR family RNA polymerase-binding regulatory protein [Lactiplantibacillus paraplantarum]|uniref:Spx/MgsR family RNA polymerase-binding regulatory protein n=1 Tax=Lactiplantibacillus paraplantarum TaxID=60520 RepID=UPI0020734FDB|nr:Spx/MgsR family RNA polymerase-binding regulatory protein [Lactiplantibacillus paraplantarum]
MIVVYTTPGCASCRKARNWLDKYNITYEEQNIFEQPPTTEEIVKILKLTERGTEEIISRRSRGYGKLKEKLADLTLGELCNLINEDPHLLRRPIIVDENRLQVGYNEEDIRKFLPHEIRKEEFFDIMHEDKRLRTENIIE